MKRLEATQSTEPIDNVQDIIDIVRHAMEALQPKPGYPSGDKQLVFDELTTVLDFFGVEEED